LLNKDRLIVSLDANVIVSAFAYDGIPLEILKRLYNFEFSHVTGLLKRGSTLMKEINAFNVFGRQQWPLR